MSLQKNDRWPTANGDAAAEERPGLTDDPAYGSLRNAAEQIVGKETVALSRQMMLDILQLAEDVETAHLGLKIQSRQLEELRQDLIFSQQRFHDLYENAPVAVVTLGKDGFIEMFNTAARQMLEPAFEGGSGEAPDPSAEARPLAGRRFASFVHEKDLGAYYSGLKKMALQKERSFFELRLTGKSDLPSHVLVQASSILDKNGRFNFWHLALSDISDLRRTEAREKRLGEQLMLATRSAQLGLWHYDLEKGASLWNDQLYLLLGLEPRTGPEDADYFFEFIHPEDRSGVVAGLQSVLELEGDHLNETFRIVRADGRIRWLASRGQLFRDENGEVLRIAGVNYDITEQKEAESALHLAHLQLSEQLKRTERVNEELSQYAYAISHDLKGPLRAIRNYADFLNEDLADTLEGEQLKYLKALKTAVEQGDALINDLLIYSRIGRAPLAADTIDIPGLVDEIRSGLGLPPEVEIEVQRQWPRICADRSLMRQILQNLITNAAKFNQRNNKRIEIGCRPVPEECVELFVRDNGIGIEPEYRNQIFKIFQRLHSSRKYDGTGIGLAIVQKAVTRLGGRVRLESEPGKGSTFHVRVPLRPVSDEGSHSDVDDI